MAPAHRGSGNRRGRQNTRHRGRQYQPSRLQDSEDEFEIPPDNAQSDNAEEGFAQDDDDDESSDDDLPTVRHSAYSALLKSLGTAAPVEEEPVRKKRKLMANGASHPENGDSIDTVRVAADGGRQLQDTGDQNLADDLQEAGEEDEDESSADEDEDETDVFETNFASPDDNELSRKLKAINDNKLQSSQTAPSRNGKWTISIPGDAMEPTSATTPSALSSFRFKQKLESRSQKMMKQLRDPLEVYAAREALSYRDVYCTGRTVQNADSLRSITCLHALNHVFKTRDRVIKNNARLAKADADSFAEYRDQGFTRPKVLILLPTRQSCVRYIKSIVEICQPEQQENRKRFEDSYVADEELAMDRPDDYRELFAGNNDDMFRIGVKFTRKTIKLFTQFYGSDIIIASPLGLRQALSGKKADSDFLSSIEILIIDQADALLMQNWEHVLHIFSHLNQQPKEAHGCDFSRVRSWYLDGNAKYLRQNIILSGYAAPQHQSLLYSSCHNIAGRAVYDPHYSGVIHHPQSTGLKQTFLRFLSPTLPKDPDSRFNHFTTTLLPQIAKYPRNADGSGLGLLIYIPDSLDFPRLRNHFSFHPSCTSISFGAVDESRDPADKALRRARSHFQTGRHSVLLYTERAHHFFRYKLRGVKKVLFYGVPSKPIFYEEVCAMVGEDDIEQGGGVRCLFSKRERLALERVVGTERVGKMVKEKGGDVFEFL